MKVGDKVLVPRTSGGQTPGVVIAINGERAICEFVVGETYQGEPTPKFLQGEYGIKSVAIQNLIPIE